jgi:hypothetical protein
LDFGDFKIDKAYADFWKNSSLGTNAEMNHSQSLLNCDREIVVLSIPLIDLTKELE